MQVIYAAPNRGHHYIYAEAFYKAKALAAFVSGFSRFSPRANDIEVGDKLYRTDSIQNIYLAALRYHLPDSICKYIAYQAKIQQDNASSRFLNKADVFLFYNGSGLNTLVKARKRGIITVVEAVNSHVDCQETLLRNEYKDLSLQWQPFHGKEKKRRMLEYEKADYILLPSQFVKNSFLAYGFPEEKLLKVPYGFHPLRTTIDKTTMEKKDFTILYVGNISIRKGLRYLIQAFLKLSLPNKKLIITGPFSSPTGFEDISIPQNIIFTGVLKGKALQDVYTNADVFCLPSIEEGLALVLGEALSFGLPIVATENSGASDIFTNGEEGYIVPIKSFQNILEKLEILGNDEFTLSTMKQKAKAKAASLHGWNETQHLLVKTIQLTCDK